MVERVTLLVTVAALVGVGTWVYRTFAFGRSHQPTVVEQRKAAWADLTPQYRRTYDGDTYQRALRLAHRQEKVG